MTSGPHLIVAIPARDEERRLGVALASVRAASAALLERHPAATVTIAVAADACTDGTAEVAAAGGALVVRTAAGRVGAARAAAVRVALEQRPDAVWIANTDADSIVPPGWLVRHAAAERARVDLLLGTVQPDPREIDPDLLRRWELRHPPSPLHGRVHGANLGVRAAVYRSVGGFPDVQRDEDVRLLALIAAAGGRIRQTNRAPVVTSARRHGRAPGGFADYLQALAAESD